MNEFFKTQDEHTQVLWGNACYMQMGIAVWTYKSVSAPPRQNQDPRLLSTPGLTVCFRDFLYWLLRLSYDIMIFQLQ